MKPLFESVVDIEKHSEVLRVRPYGVIEIEKGKLVRIRLNPYPKFGSIVEARWISQWRAKRRPADHCRLFYNQPLHHRNYLTLSYIESTFQTSWKSVSRSLRVLDRVAFFKQSDAILTEVSNPGVSDRLMLRLGWERHLLQAGKRHFIKRFYGKFPAQLKLSAEYDTSASTSQT